MNLPDRFLALALLFSSGCTAEASGGPPVAVSQSAETAVTAADDRPFDRHAVIPALKAIDLHPCVADGNEGATGHVMMTFGPDGQAASAAIDDGPTEGTAAGACLAAQFRHAAVPPFTGRPIRVGYSFVLR